MIWNIAVLVIIVILVLFALRRAGNQVKHPCAGCGGCTPVQVQEKKLEGDIRKTKTYKVKGMTCEHCYTAAALCVNSLSGLSAAVDGRKNTISVKGIRDFSDEEIAGALAKSGFVVEQ